MRRVRRSSANACRREARASQQVLLCRVQAKERSPTQKREVRQKAPKRASYTLLQVRALRRCFRHCQEAAAILLEEMQKLSPRRYLQVPELRRVVSEEAATFRRDVVSEEVLLTRLRIHRPPRKETLRHSAAGAGEAARKLAPVLGRRLLARRGLVRNVPTPVCVEGGSSRRSQDEVLALPAARAAALPRLRRRRAGVQEVLRAVWRQQEDLLEEDRQE